MAIKKLFILDYIRTSTAHQHGEWQSSMLDVCNNFSADLAIFDTDQDAAIPPFNRPVLKNSIQEIRTTNPNSIINIRTHHLDRFFKAKSPSAIIRTWNRLLQRGIQLEPLVPLPDLPLTGLSADALPQHILDLILDRMMDLGHWKSRQRIPLDLKHPRVAKILDRAAQDILILLAHPLARDPDFRQFAFACRAFGTFNDLLRIATGNSSSGNRDPGGWGKEPAHFEVFAETSRLLACGTSQRKIAKALSNHHFLTPRGRPFNRDSVRTLLKSPGYLAYRAGVLIPPRPRSFKRKALPSGLFRVQDRALGCLAAGHHVLLVAATGYGKTHVALEHHRRLLAANPGHLTVLVAPYTELVRDLKHQNGGMYLVGPTSDSLNRRKILSLEDGTEGGLVFLTPDKLLGETPAQMDLQSAIRNRSSVLLVVDEADCILEDAEYRDAYLKFRRSVLGIKPTQVLCMTASARPGFVRNHIKGQVLPNGESWKVVAGNLDRPNLTYQHLHSGNLTARRVSVERVARYHTNLGHRLIIYESKKAYVDRIYRLLKGLGYQVGRHHSDVPNAERAATVRQFRDRTTHIVVATSGFGRGLNFDVEAVVVAHIPTNLTSLAQYFGRAGRNGRPAFCWWITCNADVYFLKHAWEQLMESSLSLPAKTYLGEQIAKIKRLAFEVDDLCVREVLLNSQGETRRLRDDRAACCSTCSKDDDFSLAEEM